MNIVIPFEGRARTVLHSSSLSAKKMTETQYNLSGDTFQMTDIAEEQILILPDDAVVAEGQELTDSLCEQALPLDSFITVSAEEALPNALGLLLRLAIADGRLSDEELLSIQPVLAGRAWRAGLSVQIGDVYAYGAHLWRCVQPHTTQGTWTPDITPALWRKVETIHEDEVRVWQQGVDYAVGDVLAYPDANSARYECLQEHTSLTGWEPPNLPALWREVKEA